MVALPNARLAPGDGDGGGADGDGDGLGEEGGFDGLVLGLGDGEGDGEGDGLEGGGVPPETVISNGGAGRLSVLYTLPSA